MIMKMAMLAFFRKREPERMDASIRMIPITRTIVLVPIHEIRKNPVTKVPIIAPSVDRA